METFVCCYNFKDEKCSPSLQDDLIVKTVYDVLNNEISELYDRDTMCCKLLEFCSGCNKADEDTYIFQIDDYVTHPMTWCGCGKGLFILLKNTVKIVSKEYVQSKNPTLFTLLTDSQKSIVNDPKSRFVSIQNAFIKKISDYRLECLESEKQLSSEESLEISNELYKYYGEQKPDDDFVKNNSIAIKHELKLSKDNFLKYTDEVIKKRLNISIDVNDYNIYTEKIRKSSLCITLDDRLFLLCENEKGKEFYSTCCGD